MDYFVFWGFNFQGIKTHTKENLKNITKAQARLCTC